MLSPMTQVHRALSIETPLPFDTLLIDGFSGAEGISRPFHFDLTLLADTAFERHTLVRPEELIGHKMVINIPLSNGAPHFINGICRSFTVGKVEDRFAHYRADLVPWFALLTLSSDIRFFQNKTVPEIITEVFGDLGYQDFRIDTHRSFTKWDYCCQYRESDFNFISRLMEAEGLFYYFEHSQERHVMVITDAVMSYQDLPGHSNVRVLQHGGHQENEDFIRHWEHRIELLSSKWTTRDYHFEMPRATLEVEEPALHAVDASHHLATYDFPGEYAQKFNETSQRLGDVRPEGEKLIKLRMEAEEMNYKVISGASDVRALTSGYRINVSSPIHREITGAHLITAIQHKAFQSPGYVSDHNLTAFYDNTFTAIPADVVFRPPRTTPKPAIQGPHTAFVVDEHETPQEEIWPDKFGRVRVRFPWDRRNKYSCWLRVAQPWAGRGWGHQWVPRVGDEVLVDFIEGDCDMPIVIGSVYNSDNMPPFKLPDYKTQSGIVTRTTKQGTPHQFNMLRFDDKKGAEQVMIRSQRRGDVRIYGNFYETNHANRHAYIGWKDSYTEESGGDFNITVNGDHNVHVVKGKYEGIDKKLNQTVCEDVVEDYHAKQATLVNTKVELNSKQIIFEATTKIGFKCGPSFITLEPSGITIYGPMVKINSGGYGAETGDPDIYDPADAELSDNGEPGYLQRQRHGGGGYRGRRHRRLRSQHYQYPPRPGESPAFTDMRNRLNTSAQGRHALEVFERNNVQVTTNPGGTVYDGSTNTVNLDPARTDSPASGFVHEMGHAEAHHDGREADINNQTRADYIDTQLREDANNERRAYEAEREMNEAGGSESYNSSTRANYQAAHDAERDRLHRDHPEMPEDEVERRANDAGEARILQDYRDGNVNTGNTTPPQSYVDYWGNAWDANDRRRRAAGGGGTPAPPPDPHSH